MNILEMTRRLFAGFISLLAFVSSASSEASIALPDNSREGQDVTLYCKYDLKGSRLLSVKWFLNGEEFYRFERVGRPQQIYYTLPGVDVNLLASNEEKVILNRVSAATSGLFRCEVLSDRSYEPLVGEGVMTVITTGSSPGAKKPQKSAGKRSFFPFVYFAEKCITVSALLYYLYTMAALFEGLQPV